MRGTVPIITCTAGGNGRDRIRAQHDQALVRRLNIRFFIGKTLQKAL
jgi:hypothetical protein